MKRRWAAALVIGLGYACGNSSPIIIVLPSPTPVPTATTAPAPTPGPRPNSPPTLGIRIVPNPPTGTAPFDFHVAMCTCGDVDADPLFFEWNYGDGTHNFHAFCRQDHTYAAPGVYHAYFCVSDHINPSVCKNYTITVN